MDIQTGGTDAYREALLRFKARRPDYQRLAEYLEEWFNRTALGLGMYPIVMARAKSLESFAEKIGRKHYAEPLRDMTDLCGVRVIVHTLDQVDTLSALVEREFTVDAVNSEDKQAKLAYREFGYLSRHYVLQLKQAQSLPGLEQAAQQRLTELKFELQLRTIPQHAWADIYHELGYKNEFKLPSRWERDFARLAALLEQCDRTFQDIQQALGTYESNYGAYMSQDELRDLVARLETLLEIDEGNVSAMHRLIRALLGLYDAEPQLADVLARYGDKLQSHEPALRDIGVALCQLHRHRPASPEYESGVASLRRAVTLDPGDVDALSSLAGALRRRGRKLDSPADVDEATAWYRRAHESDPTNPYPLGNYIAEELIRRRDAEIVQYFHAAIAGAAERCRKQLEAKVNLPWALYDLGIFSLYLGDSAGAAAYYARGMVDSSRRWMVETAAQTVASLVNAGLALPGGGAVDKLLKLCLWLRMPQSERANAAWRPAAGEAFALRPVLVVAGGCAGLAPEDEPGLQALGQWLDSFRGTIVSGGTRSGIAQLVGEVQARTRGEGLESVGYAPRGAIPTLAALDDRYSRHRYTDATDFTVLEPLTFWEDYLGAGGDPSKVRLLGYNGGKIAAAEFRIALALGARVGVVRGSGRAADELLADRLWKDHQGLEALEPSPQSIGRFLEPGGAR